MCLTTASGEVAVEKGCKHVLNESGQNRHRQTEKERKQKIRRKTLRHVLVDMLQSWFGVGPHFGAFAVSQKNVCWHPRWRKSLGMPAV